MLDMAAKGFFNAIVAYMYDRIGRSFVEAIRSIGELERYYNVEVFSATEPSEPLVRNILLSVAENFSRQLPARMHDSMTGNAGDGFHNGGLAPYGYLAVRASSGRSDRKGNPILHVRFEIELDQAQIVQRFFQEYGEGLSMAKIAHRLNADGIASAGKGTWDLGSVRYILFNEAYRGWRIWNKTRKVRKPDGEKNVPG
jgi:site-specific DNA recombinase